MSVSKTFIKESLGLSTNLKTACLLSLSNTTDTTSALRFLHVTMSPAFTGFLLSILGLFTILSL